MPSDIGARRTQSLLSLAYRETVELANLLTEIGYPHNVPAGVVAIAWTLKNPAVTNAHVGSRSPAQIEEIIRASEFRLSDSEARQIEHFLNEHP